MLNIIRQNRFSLLLWFLLIVVPLTMLSLEGRRESFLFIHQFHWNWLDPVMPWITQAGEGIFISLVILSILLFYSTKLAIQLTLMQGVASFGIQLLKRVFFVSWDRPMKMLGPDLVRSFEDVNTHLHNSFPSGHTGAAFALFGTLLLLSNSRWKTLWLLPALLVAWSRIYLGQHFPMDTLAAMCWVMIAGVLVLPWLDQKIPANWSAPLPQVLRK